VKRFLTGRCGVSARQVCRCIRIKRSLFCYESIPEPLLAFPFITRRRPMKTLMLFIACVFPTGQTWAAPYSGEYSYPIKDGYIATVIGTPSPFAAKLPASIPVKEYTLPNLVKMPDVFWYNDALHFSAALQNKPAPLIFNIAGTGAAHNSAKLLMVQKALYQAGFHVINIGSPTELNFLLSASSSHIPGYAPDDVRDLYRVMQQAYALVGKKN